MSSSDAPSETYRLPRGVAPQRYALRFAPDLEACTYSGEEQIELDVSEATDRIVMNAVDLMVTNAVIHPLGATDGTPLALGVELDEANERVSFVSPVTIERGSYLLSCEFSGILNDKLSGFYRSTFVDDQGIERVIATTQFEATDARRAFPCFDEPDLKAIFSITLDAPESMLAISNSAEKNVVKLESNRRRVHFEDTIKMSTYLVCFIVGPLEATDPVDVDGVALRVIHLPGKKHLTSAAIDVATHALGFYSQYFGIPYPSDKLDLVAIPDFAAGAMENLGCVTFREAILLADPANVSKIEMQRLAEVVEHELAHMWFGDLVTMRWWNGLWLNEAFATYMSLLCQDDFRPEWQCFVSFARGKAQALAVDGLHATRPIEFPVRHPDDSNAMFDVLTYEKGASVLWMLDAYLGGTRFRDGVRSYLRAHAYGNTDTTDLWDAIEGQASDVPIRSMMDSWIFQGGYPLVSARASEAGLEISQAPFAYLAQRPVELEESAIGSNWLVPVLAGPIGQAKPAHLLLGEEPITIERASSPTIFNVGGAGFYRLHYDEPQRAALIESFSTLSALERYNFSSDTWAVILAGRGELDEFCDIVSRLADERDPHVWSTVIGALSLLDLIAHESDRAVLAHYVTAVLDPQLVHVGWTAREDEDEQSPMLRSSLVSALGTIGENQEVIANCRELFLRDRAGSSLDADLTTAVLAVVNAHASRADFDAVLDRYRNPRSPMDQIRHLNSLVALRNVEFAHEVHEMCRGEVRSQNAPFVLGGMLSNRYVGPTTWLFIRDNFDDLLARFPEMSIHRMLEGVVGLAELDGQGKPVYLDEVRSFLLGQIEGGRRRLVSQSIERLQINVRLAQRKGSTLAVALERSGAIGTTG